LSQIDTKKSLENAQLLIETNKLCSKHKLGFLTLKCINSTQSLRPLKKYNDQQAFKGNAPLKTLALSLWN